MGIRNLASWNAGLDKFGKTIEVRGVQFQKKIAFLVLGAYILMPDGAVRASAGLLQLTPVDTGRAVGNWQMTIGAPATGVLDVGSKTGIGEANRGPAAASASANAARALASLRLGQSIFITNNLVYIVVLNDGGVNRTAHHMVERAIANARAEMQA